MARGKNAFLLKGLTGSLLLLRNQAANVPELARTAQKRQYQNTSEQIAFSLKMSGRDPFPSPKYEDGFTLSGFRPQQVSLLWTVHFCWSASMLPSKCNMNMTNSTTLHVRFLSKYTDP